MPAKLFAALSASAASLAFSTQPPEPDIAIAHGHVDQNPIKFVLIQQQFRQFGAQLPILRSAGFVMLDDSAGQPVQQVGAADNADEFAVPEYRYTLDMATL